MRVSQEAFRALPRCSAQPVPTTLGPATGRCRAAAHSQAIASAISFGASIQRQEYEPTARELSGSRTHAAKTQHHWS
eukprot:4969530-Prymnesium_polylepis.1